MDTKTQNASGTATASGSQTGATATPKPEKVEKPKLTIQGIGDISAQIDILRAVKVTGPTLRSFTLSGLKTLDGLDGISSEHLCVMAAACIRQMALDKANAKDAQRLTKLLTEYGKAVTSEIELERKLDIYSEVAESEGVAGRKPGESVAEFIARVQQAMPKNK